MLQKLKELLANNKIISLNICDNTEIEDLLDLRDEEAFDKEWVRVFNALGEKNITNSDKELIDEVRQEAFLKAHEISDSSDFASCVSDDFELIAKAFLLNYNDMWLNSLVEVYAKKKFPCGELEMVFTTISEGFSDLLNS